MSVHSRYELLTDTAGGELRFSEVQESPDTERQLMVFLLPAPGDPDFFLGKDDAQALGAALVDWAGSVEPRA